MAEWWERVDDSTLEWMENSDDPKVRESAKAIREKKGTPSKVTGKVPQAPGQVEKASPPPPGILEQLWGGVKDASKVVGPLAQPKNTPFTQDLEAIAEGAADKAKGGANALLGYFAGVEPFQDDAEPPPAAPVIPDTPSAIDMLYQKMQESQTSGAPVGGGIRGSMLSAPVLQAPTLPQMDWSKVEETVEKMKPDMEPKFTQKDMILAVLGGMGQGAMGGQEVADTLLGMGTGGVQGLMGGRAAKRDEERQLEKRMQDWMTGLVDLETSKAQTTHQTGTDQAKLNFETEAMNAENKFKADATNVSTANALAQAQAKAQRDATQRQLKMMLNGQSPFSMIMDGQMPPLEGEDFVAVQAALENAIAGAQAEIETLPDDLQKATISQRAMAELLTTRPDLVSDLNQWSQMLSTLGD